MTQFLFGLRGSALTTAQLLLIVLPAFVTFGYNQSGLGGLVTTSDFEKYFPQIDTTHYTGAIKSHHATIEGVVVAVMTLGALPGCLSCSYTADAFGRRPVIFAGALLALIGQVLEASAYHLAQLIIGRFILGFGVGMLSGSVPTWLSECSEAKNRGKHVVLVGCFIALGYLLEAWINLGFYQFKTGPITWRAPIAICIIFSLIILACIFFMPESPRWLMLKGKRTAAIETMALLKDETDDSPVIKREIDMIDVVLERSKESVTSLLSLLKMGEDKLAFRFFLCMALQFFQQMSGGNLISVYSTVIFQQGLGMDAQTSRILSGACLTFKFLSCFVSFFTIDRFGRRIAFIVSGTGMATCMLCLAIATSFPKSDYAAQAVSVLFVFLFNFFIPIGFLGANFLYCTEIAPPRLRVAMASISTANHWLFNLVVTLITPVAIVNIGYKYYIVYACIGACIPPLIYFLYPETKGRKLEDIDIVFRESPTILSVVQYARVTPDSVLEEHVLEKFEVENIEKV